MTRSIAFSKWMWWMRSWFSRPAKIAASFAMLARSAPVRPAVWRATAVEVDVRVERLPARVHLEDRLTTCEVGRRDEDLPVETPGTEKSRVEILEPVRSGHHDHLVAVVEAVELDEQLVQRLILLAVEAVIAAGGADRVELVDEHDRGRILARLLEELADAGRAEPGEHLDEGRGALRVEARARLAGDRLGEERLPGARRPVEQNSLSARARRASRSASSRLQEVDDLLHLVARLLEPGDLVPRDRRLGGRVDRLRLDARHHLHRAPQQVDDHPDHHDRQPDQRNSTDRAQEMTDVRHAGCSSAAKRRT